MHKAGKKSHYEKWCKRRGIAPRFGAIGKYGSIAIVERFFRSMKSECTRRIIIPMRTDAFRHELGIYCNWYNQTRPHQGLNGKCPAEIYSSIARHAPEYDPRKTKFTLAVSYHHEPGYCVRHSLGDGGSHSNRRRKTTPVPTPTLPRPWSVQFRFSQDAQPITSTVFVTFRRYLPGFAPRIPLVFPAPNCLD